MKKQLQTLISTLLLCSCITTAPNENKNEFEEISPNTVIDENRSLTISEPQGSNEQVENKEVITLHNESKEFKKIQIHLYGEENMNPDKDGIPQKIDVCIYELNWKQSFMNKAFNAKEKKNKTLLNCKAFDKSVNNTTLISVYPGRDTYFVIDRYKKLAHVAIVASYPSYNAKNSIRLHNVPYHGISKGWTWMKSSESDPYIATITHKFGTNGIVKIKKK